MTEDDQDYEVPASPSEEAALWISAFLSCGIIFALGFIAGRLSA